METSKLAMASSDREVCSSPGPPYLLPAVWLAGQGSPTLSSLTGFALLCCIPGNFEWKGNTMSEPLYKLSTYQTPLSNAQCPKSTCHG